MSNKNQLTNVVGAYSVSMSGGVNALSYADIMNSNSPYKVSDDAKKHLLAIKEGNAEQTGATFKIGYHLAELTKGENPEYKKMGYPSIKALAVNMFDMNEVTAYAWADTASRFVEYDANTGKYQSIFATEENGKTYDFTMSQLQEMRFPIDKKTGKESVNLNVWKTVCPALINVKTTTKDIRMVKGCICALAKAGMEISVENVSDLWVKSIRLEMSPDKALPYNEEQAQAQPAQAQPAQPAQAQVQPAQAQIPEVNDAIAKAIEQGQIVELIDAEIMPKISRYLEYAKANNSTIVLTALTAVLEQVIVTVNNSIVDNTEETPAEETPAEGKGKGKGKGKKANS